MTVLDRKGDAVCKDSCGGLQLALGIIDNNYGSRTGDSDLVRKIEPMSFAPQLRGDDKVHRSIGRQAHRGLSVLVTGEIDLATVVDGFDAAGVADIERYGRAVKLKIGHLVATDGTGAQPCTITGFTFVGVDHAVVVVIDIIAIGDTVSVAILAGVPTRRLFRSHRRKRMGQGVTGFSAVF